MAKQKKRNEPIAFKIVRADSRHKPEIDRLIREAKIGDGWGDGPVSNCWVVRVGDKIVGCAALEFINERAVALTSCVVEKPYRKHGIGAALVAKRLEVARNKGCTVAALVTMYYLFRHYKNLGFVTRPRKELAADLASYHQFTAERYKKCAVMVNENI